jgi:hypothetical protein
MAFPKNLKQLCTPAYIYFVISMIMIIVAAIQNMGNNKKYSLGMFSCNVPSCIGVFLVKIIYILFWTWILNLMCKDGHTRIAWFLLFLPFIIIFILLGIVMVFQKNKRFEGMKKMKPHPKK